MNMGPVQHFRSDWLDGPRQCRVESTAPGATTGVVVLDADLYVERVGWPQVIENLRAARSLQLTFAYVSVADAAARHREFTCRDEYVLFLADELRPWAEAQTGACDRWFVMGLSLSGLAAAYSAWRRPDVFAGALCQSPSAWWRDEWLAAAVATGPAIQGRYWLSAGTSELQTDVRHPPTGLYQRTSQRESVGRLADRLRAAGAAVQLNEFDGGHDPACWAAELPAALDWLLARPAID
jgi:enterochelin esterase family protein